jgi:hypothetical protein
MRRIERAFYFLETYMQWFKQWGLALVFSLAAVGASAQSVTASGIKFDDTMDLRGSKLQLNGAGTRYRGPFKVYAAGLYMARKASTPEEAFSTPGAKRVSITMLREIDSNELGKLFSRAIEDNMEKAAFSKLVPGVMRMSQVFSDHKKLVTGDTFTIDWIPGTGTIISVKGVAQGEPFKEPEFYTAMLRIWLGPNPADWKLKDAMLGRPS